MRGIHVEADTVEEAYRRTLKALMQQGEIVPCQDKPTREVIGAEVRIYAPRAALITDPSRKFNYRYMLAEMMWNLCDTSKLNILESVHPGIVDYVSDQPEDTRDRARWAYGPDIHGEIRPVLDLLKAYPETRRAIFRPGRRSTATERGQGTPPCLEFVQFFVRHGRVDMVVFMRSNDAFMGMPYDMFTYATWQHAVANHLGLICGTYVHKVGSLHYYLKNEGRVMEQAAVPCTHSDILLWTPDMYQAGDAGLLMDLEYAADCARARKGTIWPQEISGWRCDTWARALEMVAGNYDGDLSFPKLNGMRQRGEGLGW